MSANGKSRSKEIHARLSHPIIDSDGHWREFEPVAMDYLKKIAGTKVLDKWNSRMRVFGEGDYTKMSEQEKIDKRAGQPPWWGMPTRDTLDVATSFVPKLMHDRLEEMGLDFAVLYPSGPQLFAPYLSDDELRQAGCRAFNEYAIEAWREYADRVTPIGVIPMHTPQEALAELEHCKAIGVKAVALGSLIRRSIPAMERQGVSRRYACWLDVLAIDSAHDYDPVWAKCQELGFAATFHSAAENYGLRNSLTNFVYNHMGHFGEAGNAVCKALFMGGVTRRFPKMRFAFLEGGVSWACGLYAELFGHWSKRNGKAIQDLDPANLNHAELAKLVKQYGGEKMSAGLEEFEQRVLTHSLAAVPKELDDFAACKIGKKSDIRDLFVPQFFFGCESDDPTVTYAFHSKANPYGAKLGAVLSSDISHFDVPDMTQVLHEAWELVEDMGLSEEDFHAFTFANPVKLWASLNPGFFKGTVVESAVSRYLASNQTEQAAAAGS